MFISKKMKPKILLLVISISNLLFVVLCASQVASASRARNATPSHEHKLMRELFRHYDTSVRPRYNSSQTVDVSVRFSLQQINDLEWSDDFLNWDPKEFGGLTKIVVEPTKLWVPKLAIGNSANKLFDNEHYKRFWLTVRHSGIVRWQPGGVFAIACALDMNFYPFDDQMCRMEVETWVYTSDKVNLSSSQDVIGLDTYIPHGEWTILNTTVTSLNMVYRYYRNESFPEVYFTVHIRRKYTFYFMYILLPCLMLSGVLLMIFLMPADSGEKVSLGVSILVAISVFLLLVAGNVPDTSDAVPIIAVYLTYFMMTTTMSVAFSVMVVKVHFKTPEDRPPRWLELLVFQYLAPIVCSSLHREYKAHISSRAMPKLKDKWTTPAKERPNSKNLDSPEHYELMANHRLPSNRHDSSASVSSARDRCLSTMTSTRPWHCNKDLTFFEMNEWKKMAEVLDRFFFWLFMAFLIIPTTCILGIVRVFKPDVII